MKKINSLLAIAFFCFALTACQGNQKKEKEAKTDLDKLVKDNTSAGLGKGVNTFTISAPEGWRKQDTLISGSMFTTVSSPLENAGDNFRENVNVVTENSQGYGYKEYTTASIRNMSDKIPGVKVISEEETKVDEEPAMAVIYTFPYSGFDLKNTAYITVKNNTGYIITCTALVNTFDRYQPEFLSCLKSFHIIK
jgi:hypothetical protein